jgi:uncharacterized membrane protein
MHPLITNLILSLLGLAGFFLARHIYCKKHAQKPLVCPLRSNCEVVITSRYSKILGIPIEILGMTYYAIVALVHIAALVAPWIITPQMVLASMILSTGAFLFSLYLVSIQAFVLKQWCTWCLCSAFLCAAIFFTAYLSAPGIFS